MNIAELFEMMAARFNTGAAVGVTKTFQWNITGEEAGKWAFRISDGEGQLIPGGVEKPDVAFTLDAKDWIAIDEGRLDAMKAFLTGKLKVAGDKMLAIRVPQFFPIKGK